VFIVEDRSIASWWNRWSGILGAVQGGLKGWSGWDALLLRDGPVGLLLRIVAQEQQTPCLLLLSFL
jgi:hypothetical protein